MILSLILIALFALGMASIYNDLINKEVVIFKKTFYIEYIFELTSTLSILLLWSLSVDVVNFKDFVSNYSCFLILYVFFFIGFK